MLYSSFNKYLNYFILILCYTCYYYINLKVNCIFYNLIKFLKFNNFNIIYH